MNVLVINITADCDCGFKDEHDTFRSEKYKKDAAILELVRKAVS